ncbi:MAG TPA: dethiobiotin synthase [Usitatibacteraceae bacterium]|nr:dethiobiotin synthase [Usitatibacteraceae bacterium]
MSSAARTTTAGFFVTGTDTGIGKTFVTCALLAALQQQGLCVAAMKPVSAGTETIGALEMNEDVARFQELTGHRYPLHAVNPYSLREAIAPHIAAAREGVDIQMGVIAIAFAALRERSDLVLVEGAGGFLVPLAGPHSMADIPDALALPVILVVGMRLGCLNHALLTVEAIRARGLTLAGWIANTPGAVMNAYAENLSTLKRLIDAPCLGELPYHPGLSSDAARQCATYLDTEPLLKGNWK